VAVVVAVGHPLAMNERPLASSATVTTRAQHVVANVLGDVALRGERAYCAVRVALCAGLAVLWPIAASLGNDPTALVAVEIVIIGALLSSLAAWWLASRHTRMTPAFGLVSAFVDVAGAAGLGVAVVYSPPADFTGLMHTTGFAILYIAVCATGARLSKRTAVGAGAFAIVAMIAIHLLDRSRNPTLSVDEPTHVLIGAILVVASTAIAVTMIARTQHVAVSSAQQTLMFERARQALGSYVSTEVADEALRSDTLRLGGVRQRVAILFTDLRGFTSASETRTPEQVVAELNEYFEQMVRVIRDEGGVVDKYIGDAIMAVFGAPQPRPDDAVRALRAAAGLMKALEHLNAARTARGLAPLAHGVGVHVGEVVAGNIGTAERAQFTVIGDAVNVAARLESASKEHGVAVLASREALAAAGGALPDWHDVGEIVVKGRKQPIGVFTWR
jgi:class 3 adenylate cyclase